MSYSAGTLEAWVRMDLTGSNQTFYIYYGDGEFSEKSTPSAVWDASYDGVWHMEDVDAATDSANGVALTNLGGTVNGTGNIGGAGSFDGSNDRLGAAGEIASLNGGTFTASTWVRRDTPGYESFWISQGENASRRQSLHIGVMSLNRLRFGFYSDDLESGSAFTDTASFHYIVATFNASNLDRRIYRDGTLVGNATAGGLLNTGGGAFFIGLRKHDNNGYWDGMIDEVHVSSVVRSPNWSTTEYNNQRPGSTFISAGAQQDL